MPAGQPTKYKPEYCDMLIEHRAKGFSFESFAAKINTCRSTLYNWTEAHPEFLDAKKLALEKCHAFHEQFIMDHTILPEKTKFNSAPYIFMLKNVLGWKDQVEQQIDHEHKVIYLDEQDKDL